MKTLLSLLLFANSIVANAATEKTSRKYIKTSTGYLMVLRQGDDLFAQLEDLARREKLPSATFSGMGFVNATFGYFNFETKKYEPKEFSKVELASLNGSLAWQDGKPSIHAHGVVTDKDFTAHGGHLLGARVSTGSVEISITKLAKNLERRKDEDIGANVLSLD